MLRQYADSLFTLASRWPVSGTVPSLSELRRSLWLIADEAAGNGAWLDAAMESSWDEAASLIALDEFADVIEDRHRIIANDWQAALLDGLAARMLRRALDILDSVDVAARGAPGTGRDRGIGQPAPRCHGNGRPRR